MNAIRIHVRECGHTYGIEYNFDTEDKNNDATDFVHACRTLLDKRYGWFYQCGFGCRTGYKFVEMLGSDDQDALLAEAEKIAKAIGAEIII